MRDGCRTFGHTLLLAGRAPQRSGRSVGKAAGALGKVALMTKWEYATVPLLSHATKQILDNWGEDGWELVSVIPGPSVDGDPRNQQLVAYLKREK
ncbi:hypothetical protein Nans01_15530 [Nocardiopsis ansamitocini]|uniref:DUF4177 domain-containing protein n=4 Tax=Nocardiopsidaceae TaxID=83676 RepID=A0A9W6P500_9ACTN|nr:hypothetical protein Nans01_15530 [Nocardiopsis ansamitocini]